MEKIHEMPHRFRRESVRLNAYACLTTQANVGTFVVFRTSNPRNSEPLREFFASGQTRDWSGKLCRES